MMTIGRLIFGPRLVEPPEMDDTVPFGTLSGDVEQADRALKSLTDEQFTVAIRAAAELFSRMKQEAIRRGVWEQLSQPGVLLPKPIRK